MVNKNLCPNHLARVLCPTGKCRRRDACVKHEPNQWTSWNNQTPNKKRIAAICLSYSHKFLFQMTFGWFLMCIIFMAFFLGWEWRTADEILSLVKWKTEIWNTFRSVYLKSTVCRNGSNASALSPPSPKGQIKKCIMKPENSEPFQNNGNASRDSQ